MAKLDSTTVYGTLKAIGKLFGTRIQSRTYSTTSITTLAINADLYDRIKLTAQAAALSVSAPTGTPDDGDLLYFKITDNGTTRAITWNAIFTFPYTNATNPANTTAGKTHIILFEYSSDTSKWECISVDVKS